MYNHAGTMSMPPAARESAWASELVCRLVCQLVSQLPSVVTVSGLGLFQ
jgi:hypothetical protein